MRIISKFKDYYDSCQKYGDRDDLFVRTQEEEIFYIKVSDKIKNITDVLFRTRAILLIGFCGKIYPVYCTQKIIYNEDAVCKYDYSYSYFYELDEIINEVYIEDKQRTHRNDIYTTSNIKELFNLCENRNFDDLFIEFGVPIFVIGRYININERNGFRLEKNPNLSNLNFQKKFDVFSCYQEIGMYLRNQLADGSSLPVPVGSDKVIAESKGFDKYSFRKDKETKK